VPLTEAQKAWLAQAKTVLPVPETLVKSMTENSRDPAKVLNGATASVR
jgi:hypothetical protein